MTNFLERALPLAERGFRVFPLIPGKKQPVKMATGDHFDAATTDPEQIRIWNTQEPNANVGLSPDENFCFLETDDESALMAACEDIPTEVFQTTRAGANPNRCAFYYRQTMRTREVGNMTATREGKENLFEFKQRRLIMTGPGSIHKNGNVYNVDWKIIPAMPDVLLHRLCDLYGAPKPGNNTMNDAVKQETALLDRFLATYEVATNGDWFNAGKQWLRPIECPWRDTHENANEGTSTCVVYTEGGGYGFDCKHRCSSKGWKEFRAELERQFPARRFSFVGDAGPSTTISTGLPMPNAKSETDWRYLFHTRTETENIAEPKFFVDRFLEEEGVVGLVGPARARKSIVTLNIIHALLTGESLFGHFAVRIQPNRVLYLCPESGLGSIARRLKRMGLSGFVGERLFYTSMNSESVALDKPEIIEASRGAVVFIDTAIRFFNGAENESKDMSAFGKMCHTLISRGARAVVILHHTSKGMNELSLESSRGSGDFGAFLTFAWGTTLENFDDALRSGSVMKPLKWRDWEAKPFSLASSGTQENYFLQYIEGSEDAVRINGKGKAGKAEAFAFARANQDMTAGELRKALADMRIEYSESACTKMLTAVRALKVGS